MPANGRGQTPLTDLSLQPTVEYQQPRVFFPGKHLRPRGVLQCICHDENRVALPAGGHRVDAQFFPGQDMRILCKQRDVSYWPKISCLYCSRLCFGNMKNKLQHHDRGSVPCHCTLTTNVPRILLEHVSTPPL